MAKKTFILSDNSINSYGFRVLSSGIKLDRFKDNPVMLFNHDYREHIGKWDGIRVEKNKLVAESDIDTEDETGSKVSRKVEKGYLKGASIGFRILKYREDSDGVFEVTESELMEASIVSIPSNAHSIALYDENGRQLQDNEVLTTLSALTKQKPKTESEMKLSAKAIELLGLSADATEEQINAAIEAKLKAATPAAPAAPLPPAEPTENVELKAVKDEMKLMRDERNAGIVDAAIAQGKFLAAQRDTYLGALSADFTKTKKEIDDLPVRKKLGAEIKPSETTETELSFDEMRKQNPQALLKMKTEDPEKYKELLSKSKAAKYM